MNKHAKTRAHVCAGTHPRAHMYTYTPHLRTCREMDLARALDCCCCCCCCWSGSHMEEGPG